jgi:hypothetical protein
LLGIYGTLIGLIELIFISVNQRLRSICVNQRSDFWNADASTGSAQVAGDLWYTDLTDL